MPSLEGEAGRLRSLIDDADAIIVVSRRTLAKR